MKISTKQYAIALYNAISGASAKDMPVIMKNFVSLLEKNRMLSKASQIIADFKTYYNSQQGIVEASVDTAQPLTASERSSIANEIEKITASRVELVEQTVPELISGVRLRINDTVIDGSVAGFLKQLHQQIVSKTQY